MPCFGMLLRTAGALILVVLSACLMMALTVGFALAGGYSPGSWSTDLPALAGLRTGPAAR